MKVAKSWVKAPAGGAWLVETIDLKAAEPQLSKLPKVKLHASANRANDSFDHGILPRRSRSNELLFQAQALDSTREIQAIDGIPIPQQITRRDRVGESFDHLLSRPDSRGRFSDIEMQDFATLMGKDQKHIQHSEGGGWDRKEIHCD